MSGVSEVKPSSARLARAGVSGFGVILLATVIAGLASYAVTILVPNVIGLASYAIFAVFWSGIYLVVGALFGIQQEVARGTIPTTPESTTRKSGARPFALATAGLVFVVVVATAPLWVGAVFPAEGWNLVWPLAVGTASYVLVAVLSGSLYGVSAWVSLGLMISVDAILRLTAVGVVLFFGPSITALAWAIALPFLATIVVLWPVLRRTAVGASYLDVPYRALTWNVARTIVAAASSGVMVSGFALLLGLTSHGESKALIGTYILTITLVRAPMIVAAMSLQSYFVVTFRDSVRGFWRHFLSLEVAVLVGGVVLSAAAWLVGPPIFEFFFQGLSPDRWFIATLVASSALVAALCISGPAMLARGKHAAYTAGWVAAGLVTIAGVLLPIDFTERTVLALMLGPAAGLVVHGTSLAASAFAAHPTS
jgi:hypothetical protein